MKFDFRNQNHLLALFGALFILIAIPATVFLSINAEQTTRNPQAATTEFLETWDVGVPTAPLLWTSDKFDIVVDNVDGQLATDPTTHGPVEAAHGTDCGAPIGRTPDTLNNHLIPTDMGEAQFHKNNIRGQIFYQCNNHMMTVVKSGYSVASFMPRYLLDWSAGPAVVEFDTNVYSFGRLWWDTYIIPRDDALLNVELVDQGGAGEQYPRRGVAFGMEAGKPTVHTIDNFSEIDLFRHWQMFKEAFPNDPANTDPRIRRKFRFEISRTSWKFEIQKQDGTFWTFTDNFVTPLSFTSGLVRVEHHAYNPTKDGIQGTPWSQYTYHWDNMRLNPASLDHTAFEPGPHFIEHWGPDPNKVSEPIKINVTVAAADIKNPRLVGLLTSELNNCDVDPLNTSHWRQFRINGGPWQDVDFVKNVADTGKCNRTWSTFKNSVAVVPGENTIEFRLPVKPPQATWQRAMMKIRDVEIQIDPVGAVAPPPTPSDTTAPTVSITAPSNGATVSGSSVQINATASDNVGVTKVEFFIDGSLKSTDTSSPYSYTWNTTTSSNGSHTLQAKAYDAANNIGTSASVSVTVSNVSTPPPPPSGGNTFIFSPIEDASISKTQTSTNFGSTDYLVADGAPKKSFLIKFNISGLDNRTVKSVKLRFYCTEPSAYGGAVYLTSGNAGWQEETVNWATAPSTPTRLGAFGKVTAGNYYELELFPRIKGQGILSLAVTTSLSDGVVYSSKEASSTQRPQLIYTVE